jgi:hypothetical protein
MKEKEINDFLKSKQGLSYLCMKYSKLSVKEAVREFKAMASSIK